MQEAKQSERDLVVLNVRLRGRAAPLGALLLLALLPFLGGSASPAASQQNVVLAAATAEAVKSAAAAIVAAPDEIAQQQALVVHDAAAQGGGQIVFPELGLPGTPGAAGAAGAAWAAGASGPEGVVVAGSAGPEFGSTLLAGSMAGSAGFIRPVDAPKTSGFGPRIHPLLGRAMFHTGVDLGAVCGTPIRAAAAGTVVYASTTPSWGNRIIIAHSATLKTAYGHQSRMIAQLGDVVKQGQVIGLVGTTGWSTGCHLHFDVILNNRYVDPAPYLGLAGSHANTIPFYAPAPGRPGTANSTPVVKTPAPPVLDGDVPIPTAPAKTTAPPSPKPSGTSTTSLPPKTPPKPSTAPSKTPTTKQPTTKPPVTTPSSSPSTTKPPVSTPPPTPTTTKPPVSTPPPTPTPIPTPTECLPTETPTTAPPTGSETPKPTCTVPALQSGKSTTGTATTETAQVVLEMASAIATD